MPDRPISVLRRLTNGVYVVGVAHEGRMNAFTAAWITHVSFEPLLIALSINPRNASYSLLERSGGFTVSVLGQGRLDLADHFGNHSGRDTNKLEGMRWRSSRNGAPVLTDAVAWLECRVTASMPAGDHALIVARVTGGAVIDPSLAPMTYEETGDLDGSTALYPAEFRG